MLFKKNVDSLSKFSSVVKQIRPKVLNIYFKNSIKPKYKMINLEKFDIIELESLRKVENEVNVYVIHLKCKKDDKSESIELAKFNTEKELHEALQTIRDGLFTKEKSFVSIVGALILVIFAAGAINATFNTVYNIKSSTDRNEFSQFENIPEYNRMIPMNNGLPNLAPFTEEELKAMGVISEQANDIQSHDIKKTMEEARKIMDEGEREPTPAAEAFGSNKAENENGIKNVDNNSFMNLLK